MDFMNITLKELSDRWQEASAAFTAKETAFEAAYLAFMKDSDSRDQKVEERKTSIEAENQAYAQQIESLGAEYTGLLLEGKEKSAERIKQQITEITAKRLANDALIGSLVLTTYSTELLRAADEAFDDVGESYPDFDAARLEIWNAIESMQKTLERLLETVSYAGEYGEVVRSKHNLQMHRRFNHQPEQD